LSKACSPGVPLRLFVTKGKEKGATSLSRKYLNNLVLKNSSLEEVRNNRFAIQTTIVDLVNEGFRPKDIRNNFHIVVLRAGDAAGVASAFNQVCKPKKREPKKPREERKRKHNSERSDNTKKRGGERKQERERKKKAKIDEEGRGIFVGQTVSLAHDFIKLAEQAYPSDAGEKLLGNKYTKLILDANNMMFLSSAFRACRGKKVEKLLSIAAFAFSQLVGIDTEIVFDNSKLPSAANLPPVEIDVAVGNNPTLQQLNTEIAKFANNLPLVGVTAVPPAGTPFKISTARPNFKSTDDMLISYFRNQQAVAVAPTTTTTTSTVTSSSSITVSPQQTLIVTSDRALAGELYSFGVTAIRPSKFIALLASLIQIISKDACPLQTTESDAPMEPKEVEKKEKAASQKIFEDWCFQFVSRDVGDEAIKKGRRGRDQPPANEEIRVDITNQSQEKTVDSMDLSILSTLKLDD